MGNCRIRGLGVMTFQKILDILKQLYFIKKLQYTFGQSL